MNHPKNLDRPDRIQLEKFGDKETENEIIEYVHFVAESGEFDEDEFEEFVNQLQDAFSDWDIGVSHNEGQAYISMRKTVHEFPPEDVELPEEVLAEEERKDGEWYRQRYENNQ